MRIERTSANLVQLALEVVPHFEVPRRGRVARHEVVQHPPDLAHLEAHAGHKRARLRIVPERMLQVDIEVQVFLEQMRAQP